MTGSTDAAMRSLHQVRFYVDENLAGLGLTLRRVRPYPDLVVGGHPPIDDLVPKDDPDWIPDVAARGWVVITNDRHIRTRPLEAPRAMEVGLLCVHLEPRARDARVWHFLCLVLRHWEAVEALHGTSGPRWLQLDAGRSSPYDRDYQPGKLPRLPPDERASRTSSTSTIRHEPPRPRRRRRDRADGQEPLPFPVQGEDEADTTR